MFNPWLSFGLRAWQIGLEAQSVIALRMLRLAAGGSRRGGIQPYGAGGGGGSCHAWPPCRRW
jgi:hypothetical protein